MVWLRITCQSKCFVFICQLTCLLCILLEVFYFCSWFGNSCWRIWKAQRRDIIFSWFLEECTLTLESIKSMLSVIILNHIMWQGNMLFSTMINWVHLLTCELPLQKTNLIYLVQFPWHRKKDAVSYIRHIHSSAILRFLIIKNYTPEIRRGQFNVSDWSWESWTEDF
jgi:hypothetical protein